MSDVIPGIKVKTKRHGPCTQLTYSLDGRHTWKQKSQNSIRTIVIKWYTKCSEILSSMSSVHWGRLYIEEIEMNTSSSGGQKEDKTSRQRKKSWIKALRYNMFGELQVVQHGSILSASRQRMNGEKGVFRAKQWLHCEGFYVPHRGLWLYPVSHAELFRGTIKIIIIKGICNKTLRGF